MTDWTAYETRFAALRSRLEAVLAPVAAAFNTTADFDNAGDYGWLMEIKDGSRSLGVTLYLNDSGESETGEYGVAGNLMLELIGDGGVIVGVYAPDNYTDDCWASYDDDDKWEMKVSQIEGIIADQLTDKINAWKDAT